MNQRKSPWLLASVLLSGLSACTLYPPDEAPYRDGEAYYDDRYADSDADYYYYPGVSVYFHIRSGYYYYPDHGRWLRARDLPASIHLDRRHRRHLVIRDGAPYRWHDDHERHYGAPAGQRGDPEADRHERDFNRQRHDRYGNDPADNAGDRRDPRPDRPRGTETRTDPGRVEPRQQDRPGHADERANAPEERSRDRARTGDSGADKGKDGAPPTGDARPRQPRSEPGAPPSPREEAVKGGADSREHASRPDARRGPGTSWRPGEEMDGQENPLR